MSDKGYTDTMKVLFLDRDGTLSIDPPDEVVSSFDKIQLIPETLEAMRLLATLPYGVIIITNQLGIAEGKLTEADFHKYNNRILEMLAPTGVKILKTYFCPHSPEDNCDCRKPKPGMLLEAAKEFDIDLANSYMIGDRLTDVMAGKNAGTKTISVQTGLRPVEGGVADYNARNILEAVRWIAGL